MTMDDDCFLVVEAAVTTDEVDELSGALWDADIAGLEERCEEAGVRLVVAVRASALRAAERVLAERGHAFDVRPVEPDEGLDEWRRWARPVRVGRLVVHPPWMDRPRTSPDDVVLAIDPGRSFGSGAHPTTRLALRLLADAVRSGDRVLDVGTGSGVLAIAAARLGATLVEAVDVAPEARDAARHNVDANAVAGTVVVTDSVGPIEDRFDIIVANIDAPTLEYLAPSLTARLASSGMFIASGVLVEQRPRVAAAIESASRLQLLEQRVDGDWLAARWRRVAERLS
jgi:ribosomal protein L11 methyltransferase